MSDRRQAAGRLDEAGERSMNVQANSAFAAGGADLLIPAKNYICADFARREAQSLWSRVWQMACREEEIPKVGDFYTYDIVDQSVIVIRVAEDEIKAYHNVCPHRGRTITEGCGHAARLFCKFHGWSWKLDGTIAKVVDRHEWPEDLVSDEELNLVPVK